MRRLGAVLLASSASTAVPLSPAHAAPPRPLPFAGIVSEDAFAGSPAYRDAVLRRLAALRVGTVRQTLDWSVTEPTPGGANWGVYDEWVAAAARSGIRVLPILIGAPSYATTQPSRGAVRANYPPASPRAFAGFARRAVERYGPRGSFWRAHPDIRPLPIRSWQVWN